MPEIRQPSEVATGLPPRPSDGAGAPSLRHLVPLLRALGLAALTIPCSLFPVPSVAQTSTYNLGRTPTQEEIRAWDISIGPEGRGLPPGKGTVKEGAKLFAQNCVMCHGVNGKDSPPGAANLWPYQAFMGPRTVKPLTGGQGTLASTTPLRTIGSFWPVATTLWDYINRAMPPKGEGKFTADEVYALTAYVLFLNDIIKEDEVIDAHSLPKVPMPNRNGFVPPRPEWNPREPSPFRKAKP